MEMNLGGWTMMPEEMQAKYNAKEQAWTEEPLAAFKTSCPAIEEFAREMKLEGSGREIADIIGKHNATVREQMREERIGKFGGMQR